LREYAWRDVMSLVRVLIVKVVVRTGERHQQQPRSRRSASGCPHDITLSRFCTLMDYLDLNLIRLISAITT
jgi:hypothetical protein